MKIKLDQTKLMTLGLILLTNTSFAENGHIYLGASIAASLAQLGLNNKQVSYYSNGLVTDNYRFNKSSAFASFIDVNGGYEYSLNSIFALGFGLGFYNTLGSYGFSGWLIETTAANTSTALYDYAYYIKSSRLMAEMQFICRITEQLYPYLNAGIGSAWNRMNSRANQVASTNGFFSSPALQKDNQAQFAYQLGLGLTFAFDLFSHGADLPQDHLSLGYRYANLGHASWGFFGGKYFQTGNLSTNEVYLGYAHLF